MCLPRLIITPSGYFNYRTNKPFTCSRCVICVSCSVQLISTWYVREGSWAFYLTHKPTRSENAITWQLRVRRGARSVRYALGKKKTQISFYASFLCSCISKLNSLNVEHFSTTSASERALRRQWPKLDTGMLNNRE